MHDIETENQKLRETLEEYNKEFAEVKNQGMVPSIYYCADEHSINEKLYKCHHVDTIWILFCLL